MPLFPGTPFKPLLAKLLGVKMGRKVYDDGCSYYEKTLIEIGDNVNINQASVIQGHSLEEGIFKSDRIKIGSNSSIGAGAFVHYGVAVSENVTLDADCFLMKGETPAQDSWWQGNPAKSIGRITSSEQTSEITEPKSTKREFAITKL